tara:strand:- start:19011 stop:19847 length:837 start_codon:yes stop_codon:yes gene_type:complete
MKFFIAKLKLINFKNLKFIIYKRLYLILKFLNLKILYITNSPKFKSLPYHYQYFEKIIKILNENNLNFILKEKKILEIGGGEFWGLMPFFIKHGSLSYTNIDPYSDNNILKAKKFKKLFNKQIKEYIDIKYIRNFNKSNFSDRIENLKLNSKYDFIVSVSCLEHVNDVKSLLNNITKVSNNKTEQVHIINFSNHLSKSHPFKYLYSNSYEEILNNFDLKINLLRPSDYFEILDSINLKYKFIVLDVFDLSEINLNSYWKKYNKDILKIKSGILVIKKN